MYVCIYVYIYIYIYMYVCMYVLDMLVPNSRDWHEKVAAEFFALQNTP